MSDYPEIDKMLQEIDAFAAGGQPEAAIEAAERKLGLRLPKSFRKYLLEWGNISFGPFESYGLTQNCDFENSGIPNCVWFTIKKREAVGLPANLVVFRNENDDVYLCLNTGIAVNDDECSIAKWNNVNRCIEEVLQISFIEYLAEELRDCLDEGF